MTWIAQRNQIEARWHKNLVCAVKGCTHISDPRTFIHGWNGVPVYVCDGHWKPCSGDPCTCAETKQAAIVRGLEVEERDQRLALAGVEELADEPIVS